MYTPPKFYAWPPGLSDLTAAFWINFCFAQGGRESAKGAATGRGKTAEMIWALIIFGQFS